MKRAEELYERVFNEYGDDSVAQLGGVHLACERASNILTKVLEWGRLAAYLEQSTRYVPYTDRTGGRWRYHVPAELDASRLRPRYVEVLDQAFETYASLIDPMREHYSRKYPQSPGESDNVYRIREFETYEKIKSEIKHPSEWPLLIRGTLDEFPEDTRPMVDTLTGIFDKYIIDSGSLSLSAV